MTMTSSIILEASQEANPRKRRGADYTETTQEDS